MSELPTRFVTAILVIGILIGAATTTTVISGGLKPSNLALAQLRFPVQTQQPLVQAPVQGQPQVQQPLVPAASTTGGAPFGPSCTGCVTTQNLANGAVTNPKLGPLSVSSANIGTGQVATGNIADQAVTTQKIAPGAISMSVVNRFSNDITLPAGGDTGVESLCNPGETVTGGGYSVNTGVDVYQSGEAFSGSSTGWLVRAYNPGTTDASVTVQAMCVAIHP